MSQVCCSSSLVDFLAKERKTKLFFPDFLRLPCFLLDHFAQPTHTHWRWQLPIQSKKRRQSRELSNSVAILKSLSAEDRVTLTKKPPCLLPVCLLGMGPASWCPSPVHKRLNGPFAWHSKASSSRQSCRSDSTPICTADVAGRFLVGHFGRKVTWKPKRNFPSIHVERLFCFVLLSSLGSHTEIGSRLPK